MRNVRVRFEKVGYAKYISHLDLTRCMSRAMKRAQIPLWYTEGFNPHLYMTFALPLSLGTQSVCESMDIRVEGEIQNDEIKELLLKNMPTGINVYSVENVKMKASEIALAEYDILLELENSEIETFFSKTQKLLNQEELLVEKLGKKGKKKVLKQINVIEHIKKYEVSQQDGKVKISAVLSAGSNVNLNPSLLVQALERETEIQLQSVDIIRINLLTKTGETFI